MRKPFPVRGFEVTETNMDAIARWCVGHVVREDVPRPFVRVPVSRSVNEKQTRAYVGTWVIASVFEGQTSYKVYKKEWLDRTFITQEAWDDIVRMFIEMDAWPDEADELMMGDEESPQPCCSHQSSSPAPTQRSATPSPATIVHAQFLKRSHRRR